MKVRPHPASWLVMNEIATLKAKYSEVSISKKSLRHDMACCTEIFGVASSVLLEGLIMGLTVYYYRSNKTLTRNIFDAFHSNAASIYPVSSGDDLIKLTSSIHVNNKDSQPFAPMLMSCNHQNITQFCKYFT